MKRKLRIVKPFRFFTFVLVVTLTIIFILYTILSGTTEASAMETYRQVTVHQNETLWTIAEENSSNHVDTRDLVAEICDINDVKPDEIQPGDTLIVPVEASEADNEQTN